jgi:hypothetical protein
MPATKKICRGVQNIRTMSGRVDDKAIPYKAYMKLSMLEMEKYRRGIEKECAIEKVQKIDQRFQEIEVEKQQTLQRMETRSVPAPYQRRVAGQPSPAPRANTGAFKIKY